MLQRYRRWNIALNEHLSLQDKGEDEIFLYITHDVLDEISEKKRDDLGGHQGFEDCVKAMFNYIDRDKRLIQYWRDLSGSYPNKEIVTLFKSKSSFDCAWAFAQAGSPLRCGYLNLLAYALLKLNSCVDKGENAIGKYLKETIRYDFGGEENGDYRCIRNMFTHLNKAYPKFQDISLNGYPFVGRLRYQLILSPSQSEEISRLLFERRITTSMIDKYETTLNSIHGCASDELRSLLDLSLSLSPYRRRIQNIFNNFDFDAYANSLGDKDDTWIIGELRHAMYFRDGDCHTILLTDICNENISVKDSDGRSISITAEPFDRIMGLNPQHVLRDGNDNISLNESVCIDQNGVKLSTKATKDIRYFENWCSNYYIETESPSSGSDVYIVVKNDRSSKKTFEKIREAQTLRTIYDPTDDTSNPLIPKTIGKEYYLYECKWYQIDSGRKKANKSGDGISKRGGIMHPGHRNEYLVNSLPEYLFPPDIDINHLTLSISNNGEVFDSFQIIRTDENGIIIDVSDYSKFSVERASRLELQFKSNNKTLYIDSLYVIKAPRDYNLATLRVLNKWGQPLQSNCDTSDGFYAWGEKLNTKRVKGYEKFSYYSTKHDLVPFEDSTDPRSSYYLINLIAAVGLSKKDMMITRTHLIECIMMAAARKSILIDEKRQIRNVIAKLINFGYILPIYGEGQTRYQVLPPMFVRSCAPVNIVSRGNDPYIWVLMGCFTRGFLDYLINNDRKKMRTSMNEQLSLVGSRILLHHDFDPEKFTNESKYECIIANYDLVTDILSGIPTVDEYIDETLTKIPNFGVTLMPAKNSDFPRVRQSIGKVYQKQLFLEKTDNNFWGSNVSDSGWLHLTASKLRDIPQLFINNISFLLPVHMRIPSIIERVLGMVNINQPEHVKGFVIDTTDESHALYCDFFKYGLDSGGVIAGQLRRIFGEPGQLYSECSIPLNSPLALYTGKARFSNDPSYALEYTGNNQHIIAYWLGSNQGARAFIEIAGNSYEEIDMSTYGNDLLGLNRLISSLIKGTKAWYLPVQECRRLNQPPYDLSGYTRTDIETIDIETIKRNQDKSI